MNKNTPISELMTRNVVTLNVSDSLDKAEHLFKENHIRHLPVTEGSKLVGILSLTDLQRMSFADTFSEQEVMVDTAVNAMLTVQQVMNQHVVSVDINTTIYNVACILGEKEFHALPITHNGKLEGIVTTTDLIRFMTENCFEG